MAGGTWVFNAYALGSYPQLGRRALLGETIGLPLQETRMSRRSLAPLLVLLKGEWRQVWRTGEPVRIAGRQLRDD